VTVNTPEYEAESVFEEGRGLPFTQLGDWVNHAGISDRAARIYWTLCEHLNIKRGDRAVWPAQKVLAKVLGIKRAADVAPAIDELVAIGAVEIRADYDENGRRVRNRYLIHRAPDSDYVGPRSLAEFYRLLRKDDGKQYEAWFAARRSEIAEGVERLARERTAADARAKEQHKRRSVGGAGSRTSAPPATTPKTAGQVEVRKSAPRGAGSRTTGVRDPALEQDVVELDESLSPRLPQQTAEEPPVTDADEREIDAALNGQGRTPATPTPEDQILAAYVTALGRPVVAAVRNKIHDQAGKLLAEGLPAWWLVARAKELPDFGTDLSKHCEMSRVPTEVRRPDGLTPPCNRHDKNNRMIRDHQGDLVNCPDCHPAELARRQRQGAA
jgi:hypothetical protein